MPMYINTNVASLQSQRNLNRSQEALQSSFRRLSSGLRINQAADDAAGCAVTEAMKAQIRCLVVAERNANNAVSMTQTAEGGLAEISNMVVRMRELAVQSANGDLTGNERGYLDTEFQLLTQEIDRVAATTTFNGQNLLAGAAATIDFQVGINNSADDIIQVGFGGIDTTSLGLAGVGVSGATAANALAALTAIDVALTNVSTRRAEFGGAMNRIGVSISNTQTIRNNLAAANSVIQDVDVASETSRMASSQVLLQAGTAILAQANQAPQLALQLLK